jgi:ATP-binding cassette subfamily C protein
VIRTANQPDELQSALGACIHYFITALIFSLAINLLYLAAPLYMLQVYDRVITSASQATLVMLTLLLLLALVSLGGLDVVRARVLTRAGVRLDRLLAERVFAATMEGALRAGLLRAKRCAISIRSGSSSPVPASTPCSICPGPPSTS